MSDFLRGYLTVAIFAGAAGLLVAGVLGLSRLIQPRHPTQQKLIAYESGVDPLGGGWSQSHVRYYLYGLLFVFCQDEESVLFQDFT